MTTGNWVLVILTGIFLPAVGFVGGALVSKRHWTAVLRDRWHKGFTTGRQTAYDDLESFMWKETRNLKAAVRTGSSPHAEGYVSGWEDAATHLTHLTERLADDDDGAL